MTTAAIIQARASSSRLPGKVLSHIDNRSILQMIIERVSRSQRLDRIVVATTTSTEDDAIQDIANAYGVEVVRGSALDVLSRFNLVLETYTDIDIVVRLTADCPFVDGSLVDEVVDALIVHSADFAANRLPPPWKRTYPLGLDVETCLASVLKEAHRNAMEPFEREHVMPYLYREGSTFKRVILDLPEDLSHLRWTVDTSEDLEAVRTLARLCGPEPYGWRKVLEVARTHSDISNINSLSKQKSVHETDARWQ